MKPLAAPVLGGMLSSLAHVLLVTPVIFFLIRKRQLAVGQEVEDTHTVQTSSRFPVRLAVGAMIVLATVTFGVRFVQKGRSAPEGVVVNTIPAGDLSILLLSPTGSLHLGANAFTVEFRRSDGSLADVGAVRGTANMPMPGMVMPGGLELRATDTKGRYGATANFGMAGGWQMTLAWSGPGGQGNVNFVEGVQ